MMGKEIDPSDIGKHPKIIRVAQNDMAQTDVLVCGKCHNVFHFIELFQEHKDMGCEKDSELKDSRESKPKVWAFLLWKAAQLSLNENLANTTNSWKLYQQWVKMEDSVRETWIVAGKTIQSFAKMGQGNLQEMPVKITKTVVDNTPRAVSTPKPGPRIIDNKQIFKKDANTDNEEEMSPVRADQNRVIRKPVNQINQIKTPPNNAALNKTLNRRASRTVPNTNGQEIEEETVEKIIAKRFNPRRKMHEYLVKWDGFPHDQNTWEPQTHLDSCPQLLETFEKQLARQKEQRAAQAAKQAAAAAAAANPQPTLPTVKDAPQSPSRQGQLARNLKTRVTDQKSWSPQAENSSGGTKRKLDESEEFDESGAAEDDPDENGAPASKRLRNGNAILRMDSSGEIKISQVSTPSKTVNGNIRASSNDSSAEVIITKDNQSSGIVKKAGIVPTNNQKSEAQVRVLSKGENTSSGIVRINKLPPGGITAGQTRITQISGRDSTAQARSLSNSSTPSPRTVAGQTRIVQRTTISPNASQPPTKPVINRVARTQPDKSNAITPEQKIIQLSQKNDLKVTRKIVHSTQPQTQQSPQQSISKLSTSSDLPEDPFPEPQSPPRPLTLCPVTGKVLSQAEGEPSPVPSPEPAKKENETNSLQSHQANITSVGILQTNDVQADQHQENAEGIHEGMALAAATEDGQTQHILTSEDGTPLLVTGEDGTIYQVAGKNAEGQTILIAQGADGEQQYAYVAAEEGDEGGVLTLDNAVAEAVAQMLPEQQAEALAAAAAASGGETQFILKQEDGVNDGSGDATEALTIQTGDGGDSQDGNIPAEVVQADLPSPGGTRRVVLLLQDGTFMMTEMHDDEYQALNIVT
ncbi:unnamed protein product [Hermetia illucens]|uniref:Chromo domain-containing protein n=1 Tax=Hermetia illucens TaxID=343691 RepID=A0A7R8YQ96_HERIL|nr:flocculation protein FLO11 [Hermetia illucens]CAD7081453.1 unnamed protein product [Hermetia illucens]